MDKYSVFLRDKEIKEKVSGLSCDIEINAMLFDYQKAIVKWALKRGKAAIFADTGLGKSFMQIEWAYWVSQLTGNRVLIVTPLCVAEQICEEADKLGYYARYVREFKKDGSTGIYVTNYEMLHHFEDGIKTGYFDGIVLDESSIIKNKDSKTRNFITTLAEYVPYRLSCTATPSPNDYMELGTQAEFLGVMRMQEMLAMFFIHDSGETSKWRLKGHGRKKFWEWLSSWACVIKRPSDIGFDDSKHVLPELKNHEIIVPSEFTIDDNSSLSGRNTARKLSVDERVAVASGIANSTGDQYIIWCNLNEESEKLTKAINGAVEVKGSDSITLKESNISAFTHGHARVIVTKPSIAGFGLNWQHCNKMIFVGLNDSYEQIYQAVRRCWRFGQTKPVHAYFISSVLEGPVNENLKRKEEQAEAMSEEMVDQMKDFVSREVNGSTANKTDYMPRMKLEIPHFMRLS